MRRYATRLIGWESSTVRRMCIVSLSLGVTLTTDPTWFKGSKVTLGEILGVFPSILNVGSL